MASLRKTVLSRGAKRFSSGSGTGSDCSPVKWTKYFDSEQQVHVNGNVFHVYLAGTGGPVLVLIHGGGYSALTWALLTEEIINKIECQVMAIDLRGHGNTETIDEDNLSLEVLSDDVMNVLDTFYENKVPPVVLIGHSLGGAIAVAASSLIPSVVGVCVIDVVEGTALESLSAMQSILRGRPTSFKSVEYAIQWCFRSGQTHNLEAARVSMPGQIKSILTGQLASNESCESIESETNLSNQRSPHAILVHQRSADAIEEECEEEEQRENHVENHEESSSSSGFNMGSGKPPLPNLLDSSPFKVPAGEKNLYTWRIDLSKTEPFWNGWFKGLSQKFLDIQAPKVLILANIHGLDTALTVGQMQGKFQLQVLPRSGHAIHEDQPHHVADIIAGFLVKQKLTVARNGFTPTMPAC